MKDRHETNERASVFGSPRCRAVDWSSSLAGLPARREISGLLFDPASSEQKQSDSESEGAKGESFGHGAARE